MWNKILQKGYKVFFVYIKEAHADDTWPLGLGIETWKNKDQNISRLKLMENKYPKFQWFGDCYNDLTSKLSLWPERILVIENTVIKYDLAPPKCHGTNLSELFD